MRDVLGVAEGGLVAPALPCSVGTGTTPQLTLPLYAAIAHGPTIDMAAMPSANASPL